MQWTQEFQLSKSAQNVKSFLIDFTAFGKLHPLILKTEQLASTDTGNTQFKIFEKPYAFLPFKVTYQAEVITTKANTVIYKASGLPIFQPILHFHLQSLGESLSLLKVQIDIHEKGIGRRILLQKMAKAQEEIWTKFNKQH